MLTHGSIWTGGESRVRAAAVWPTANRSGVQEPPVCAIVIEFEPDPARFVHRGVAFRPRPEVFRRKFNFHAGPPGHAHEDIGERFFTAHAQCKMMQAHVSLCRNNIAGRSGVDNRLPFTSLFTWCIASQFAARSHSLAHICNVRYSLNQISRREIDGRSRQ